MADRAGRYPLVPPGICPTCGQRTPETGRRRICGSCKKPILRGHKFFFVGSEVRHRNCAEPGRYQPEGATR